MNKPARLVHFTPLRYPGGKGKLAPYLKSIIELNSLYDGEYVEPYAGGAAIGLELLLQEYVSKVHINDLSKPVYSFWKSVLNDTEELCKLVTDTKLSIKSWDKQRNIFRNPNDYGRVELGFATFFLNRTNRSGILNGGVIGGRKQKGAWKMDARYNAAELVFRIQSIATMRKRIRVTRYDALDLLQSGLKRWPKKTLIYFDPPYYEQGRRLYYDYYKGSDHENLSKFITTKMKNRQWLVSYDNVAPIRSLYSASRSIVYNVGYTAREQRVGREVMFFSPKLEIPSLIGPVKQIGKVREAA